MQSTNDPRLLIGVGAVEEVCQFDRSLAFGSDQPVNAIDGEKDL